MSKGLIKVCYYARVSTKSENQKDSFEHQQVYFKELLNEERGFDLVGEYTDEGTSGTKLRKREGFNRLLFDSGLDMKTVSSRMGEVRNKYLNTSYTINPERKPKFKFIYIKDSSRFARNTSISDIIKLLRINGVYIYFLDLGRDNFNDNDNLIIDMLFSLASQESISRSAKIKFGNKQTAKEGKIRVSNDLYGYTINRETNSLIAISSEADTVKKIFELRANGNGTRKIANYLKENNIKTRRNKEFSTKSILNILNNLVYIGKVARNKTENKYLGDTSTKVLLNKDQWIIQDNDRIEKIIDEELYDEAQLQINKSKSREFGKYHGKNILVGKITCSKCGKHYTLNQNNNGRFFYNCATKKNYGISACDSPNISQEEIYKQIDFYCRGGQFKRFTKNYLSMAIGDYEKKKEGLNKRVNQEEIDVLTEEINRYKSMLSKLMDMFLLDNSEGAKELFNIKKEEIDEKIKEKEKILNQLTSTDKEKEEKINTINEHIRQIRTEYETTPDIITREDFMKKYIGLITVDEEGKCYIWTSTHLATILIMQSINGKLGTTDLR